MSCCLNAVLRPCPSFCDDCPRIEWVEDCWDLELPERRGEAPVMDAMTLTAFGNAAVETVCDRCCPDEVSQFCLFSCLRA
jgi:hypothetical protein